MCLLPFCAFRRRIPLAFMTLGSGLSVHPTPVTLGLLFPSAPWLPVRFKDRFTSLTTTETVLIHMELVIFHLILLIIYMFYGRESPRGVALFRNLLYYLDGQQKPFSPSEEKQARLQGPLFQREGRKGQHRHLQILDSPPSSARDSSSSEQTNVCSDHLRAEVRHDCPLPSTSVCLVS